MNWNRNHYKIKLWRAKPDTSLRAQDYAYLIGCGIGVRTVIRPGQSPNSVCQVFEVTTSNEEQESQMLLLLSGQVDLASHNVAATSQYRFNV